MFPTEGTIKFSVIYIISHAKIWQSSLAMVYPIVNQLILSGNFSFCYEAKEAGASREIGNSFLSINCTKFLGAVTSAMTDGC